MRRAPLRRAGKRTLEWDRVRAELKPLFERAGITRCEFHYDGCVGGIMLGFAHADKRRFLSQEQLREAALACSPCHQKLDTMKRSKMNREVRRIIAKRICQP